MSKVEKLLEYHEKVFKQLNEPNPYYKPGLFYDKDINKKKVKVFNFFENDFEVEGFVYIEKTTSERELINPKERILYRWKPNIHAKNEYVTKPLNNGGTMYLVPAEEFEVVSINNVILDKNIIPVKEKIRTKPVQTKVVYDEEDEDDNGLPNPDLDLPMDQMTTRDYAAIHLRIPDSHKPWLNEMIKKANR